MSKKKNSISYEKKEEFYERDVESHVARVAEMLQRCSSYLLKRAETHDLSKLRVEEKKYYVLPVWELNSKKVKYGSDRYKEIIKKMGKGLEHHLENNDHHIEFYEQFLNCEDPIKLMNLFSILEMLCDWIAAASRKGTDPAYGLKVVKDKWELSPQLESILRNTLEILQNDKDPHMEDVYVDKFN